MALLQKGYLGSTPLWRNEDWFEEGAFNIVDFAANSTVTANSSAHTKGNWQQIFASTSANASFLYFSISGVAASGANTATLLDIATGAGGSETIIAGDIAIGSAAGVTVAFPYKLPSGTRLTARIQSVVTGGKTANIRTVLVDAGDYATAPTSVDVIGGNTANSQGISFSGASGTWVEGVASTSRAYRAVSVVLSGHDAALGAVTNGQFTIGVGAASSEISFGDLRFNFNTVEQASSIAPFNTLFGRNIPAGSRLAVEHPISADPSKYGFNLIGIP
jgi:hypothetical protein